VFSKVGRHLPRTSRAQRAATRYIRRSDRRRGDLVFFAHGGRVYHVAIYAGHNSVWHAPRTGQRVRREHIWTRSVSYGRVR
jgi:cell wall-associated NlpC family hydrolase